MFKRKLSLYWIFLIIIFLAVFIRLFNLSSNPPELFSDEITHVLSARTIIETGVDINGKLNLYLYNRLKLGAPIYGYLAALSTYVFGDNNFAVRLPAAILGIVTVFLIYKLAELITKDKTVPLLSAFVAAITPWNIYFSRIAWEPSLILPFILSGILAFYHGIKSEKTGKIIIPYTIFAVAVYGADALEVLAPLFLFILIVLNAKNVWKNKRKHMLGIAVFALLLVPYAIVNLNNPLKYERSARISTFAQGINKQTSGIFIKNYLAHFSPDFLFTKGDPNLRHGTGTDGVLYWTVLPFILIGIFYLIKNFKKSYYSFLLVWLLIFPLGGSLTNDGVPHATRTLIGDPVLIILFAVGFYLVLSLIKKGVFRIFIISLFVFTISLECAVFLKNYFVIYPANSAGLWDYGQAQIFNTIKNISTGNEKLCLTNIEYWHQDTYTNYYLGVNNKYKIIFDINSQECLISDIVVADPNFRAPSTYGLVKVILSPGGRSVSAIYKLSP